MRTSRLLNFVVGCAVLNSLASSQDAPPVPREFRAAWVATVDNIDWPTRGAPVAQQREELQKIFDVAAESGLNAIVFQIRPACDALYKSELEPWSPYLTGTMGKSPGDDFDPLTEAITLAHQRGIELHAWFNPYRAKLAGFNDELSADHVSHQHPDWVRRYGDFLWLDPGEPAAVEHSLRVIDDVVRRYDVDGIHIDDYFYPYQIKDESGNTIPFPDATTYAKRPAHLANLSLDDWRRANVDDFVQQMYQRVKRSKPWVKMGISPFGIWRPGHPPSIEGLDAYATLYADARKWFREGWVDYLAPQLYWPITQTPQSYPVLLEWWGQQNLHHRHLWIGNYTSRLGSKDKRWALEELLDQIRVTRHQAGAGGNIHFSMRSLMRNQQGIRDALTNTVYSTPALVPESPWLSESQQPVVAESIKQEQGAEPGAEQGVTTSLHWISNPQDRSPWLWVVQWQSGDVWSHKILPGDRRQIELTAKPDRFSISAVSRTGRLLEMTSPHD